MQNDGENERGDEREGDDAKDVVRELRTQDAHAITSRTTDTEAAERAIVVGAIPLG